MHVYKVYLSKQSMTDGITYFDVSNKPTYTVFFFFFQHFNVRLYQITFIFSIFHAFSWRTITNTETPPRARISELPSYRSCRRFVVDRLVTADPGRG